MSASPLLQALEPVVRVFEALGIAYYIGGSVASSAYGIARATLDVDLVADISGHQIKPLANQLRDNYYIDEDRVGDAVSLRSSFNLIHLESMIKVDVFVVRNRSYDRLALTRARSESLDEAQPDIRFYFASPEDVILNKLDWYRQGGGVSERQWNDVLGIFKAQQSAVDIGYLRRWAHELGLSDLLLRALQEAGMSA